MNPNYGNLTLNTLIRIAAGFDVAFIGHLVPFSELGRWFINLSEATNIPSFEQENTIAETAGIPALLGIPAEMPSNAMQAIGTPGNENVMTLPSILLENRNQSRVSAEKKVASSASIAFGGHYADIRDYARESVGVC